MREQLIELIPTTAMLFALCGLIALWIWVLLHILKRRDLSVVQKTVWIIFVTMFHVVGMMGYALVSKPKYS
jgi:uncharacterized protein YacL